MTRSSKTQTQNTPNKYYYFLNPASTHPLSLIIMHTLSPDLLLTPPSPNYDDNRIGLIGLLCEQVQQLILVHVYQRFHVDSQLGRKVWYIHPK